MADEVKRLIAAANKAGVPAKCPSCGQESFADWSPLGSVVGIPLDTTDALNLHRALGFVCDRCGFIKLHSTAFLDQHMDPRDT